MVRPLGLLQHFRQHDHDFDFPLQYPAGDVCYQKRKVVLDLRRGLLVPWIDVKQRPVGFGEPDAGEDPIDHWGA